MIFFATNSVLPIEAATTMGVSVKETDGAIGKFGTGLKYAIAGILRLGGSVSITIDGDLYEFTAKAADIRGREFRIVHCNDVPCGFTTELGKHWEPWQLFRELASNTLDEGGSWSRTSVQDRTVIAVNCREVEAAADTEAVFRRESRLLVDSSYGAKVYEGPSKHYYYKGIRAGSFGCVAPVTVDVTNGSLSEDRLLDLSTVRTELSWAFRTSVSCDDQLLLSVMAQGQPGDFWVENVSGHHLSELPEHVATFLAARPKFVHHPAMRRALDIYLKKSGTGRWEEIAIDARTARLFDAGERLALTVGIDPIPRSKLHLTRDLDDRTMAVTCMDTRDVWFSTKCALMGRDEFLAGYLEEAMHAMTGLHDCTREFQNAWIAMVVRLGTEQVMEAAA